ncbi:MAG: lysine--tRNA ligase, partial [Coriobacteriales bacterium]|nr:lysine--tRNA ligase [Coriobacteriales bacterium]
MSTESEPTREQLPSDDPIEVRKAKRLALIEQGEEPYARSFEASTQVDALEQRYAELEEGSHTTDVVSVAGRIMAIRDQGKVAFIVVRDATAEVQLFCRIDDMGAAAYN